MKSQKKINELLGSEKNPIKLRELDNDLAKSSAAPEAGTQDGNQNDDKFEVDKEKPVIVGELSPAQREVIPMKALSFALGYLLKGYTKKGDKFLARIGVKGKDIKLGLYDTEKEATQAYLDAKEKYHIF